MARTKVGREAARAFWQGGSSMKDDIRAMEQVRDIVEEARDKLQKLKLPSPPSDARFLADYVGDILLDVAERASDAILDAEFYSEG